MPETFSNLQPSQYDGTGTLLKKILLTQFLIVAAVAGGGGSGGNILTGGGDPNGVTASTATPQLYYGTSGPSLWVNNGAIGSTVWTQLI